MGVTIHFEGRAISPEAVSHVVNLGRSFARNVKSEVSQLDADFKKLPRVRNELDWDYEGPVQGIQFLPDPNCEPLTLEFDRDLYVQEYCKTQFAGIATHIEIINFLRNIAPYFHDLTVVDEGEYWETSDVPTLEKHFENFFRAADEATRDNPKLKGPIRLDSGRIIDLMEL